MPFVNTTDDENYRANLEKALQEKKIDYTRIYNQKDGSCIIKLTDGSLVIISSQKDINREISSLQFILKRLTMEGKEFTKLDLRFEKPVITFK
jgi:hypothetical protein